MCCYDKPVFKNTLFLIHYREQNQRNQITTIPEIPISGFGILNCFISSMKIISKWRKNRNNRKDYILFNISKNMQTETCKAQKNSLTL